MDYQLTLDDLYSREDAVAYINERLSGYGAQPIAEITFRTHIYKAGRKQIEPLRLGDARGAGWESASYRVFFTRRMLDEYLENRAHNARRDLPTIIVEPTAEETAAFLGSTELLAYANERLAAAGLPELSNAALKSRRDNGEIPYRVISQMAVYLRPDVERFVDAVIAYRAEAAVAAQAADA